MQINCKGKFGKNLNLGVQTNKDKVASKSISLARSWAPTKAKSFSIVKLFNTDYHGRLTNYITGYASIEVCYYSTEKEGDHLVNTLNI